MFFLVIFEILGVFVNTLTGGDKYPLWENFREFLARNSNAIILKTKNLI